MAPQPRQRIDWTVGLPQKHFPGTDTLTEGTPLDVVGPPGAMRVYPREWAVLSAAGSQGLGLEAREHGLLLCETDDGERWTLFISAVKATHSLRRGWPDDWK